MILFFIELSTRRAQIAGISTVANGLWMNQIARYLTEAFCSNFSGCRVASSTVRPTSIMTSRIVPATPMPPMPAPKITILCFCV